MKLTPRLVVYVAVSSYLSETELQELNDDLAKKKPKQDRKFLAIIKKHFDFERMKDKPLAEQDIWIYNYLQYEVDGKFPRIGLIAKYERLLKLPLDKKFNEMMVLLS
ncbi:MAG: hypothetical protein U0T84_05960 [Chitinophagales bacterium]